MKRLVLFLFGILPTFKFFSDVRGINHYEAATGDILPRSRMPLAGDWEFNMIGKVWNLRIARSQIALWKNYVPLIDFVPRLKREGLTCALLVLLLFVTACDGVIAGFKSGLAASKPFVQSLVDTGEITQKQADTAVGDISDGVNTFARADKCLDQAKPLAKGEKRVAKAKCYFAASEDLRGILARRNFEVSQKLTRYSTIVAGAIEALEAYYKPVLSDGITVQSSAASVSVEDADKELERKLKERMKEMDALIKGN